MVSLRRRLLLGTAAGIAVIFAAAGTVLFGLMRASLLREFDTSLVQKALTLSALVEQDDNGISLEFSEAEMAEFRRRQRPEYFQVWGTDGKPLEKSPSLGNENLPRKQGGAQAPPIDSIVLPNMDPGRLVTMTFTPRLDEESPAPSERAELTMALARDTIDVEVSLGRLRLLLLLVGVSATLASVGVLAWLVRLGLRPVDRLAAAIGLVDEKRLSASIDSEGAPSELLPIVVRLNELLQRLDSAFQREKLLTANVSHELRTPLAGIRSTLEVALSRERDWTSSQHVMSECLRICVNTQRMIENLLVMVRLESGGETIHQEPVDAASLLRKAWTPFESLARDRRLIVRWDLASDLHVHTDPDRLMIVFGNILENAVRYTDEGGTVAIAGDQLNDRVRIGVANSGNRLSTNEVARVFEPFWRGDQARTATGTHSGLGLALSKMIITSLGGEILAELTNPGSFLVTVIL